MYQMQVTFRVIAAASRTVTGKTRRECLEKILEAMGDDSVDAVPNEVKARDKHEHLDDRVHVYLEGEKLDLEVHDDEGVIDPHSELRNATLVAVGEE